MRKIALLIILIVFLLSLDGSFAFFSSKKQQPVIFLTPYNPEVVQNYDSVLSTHNIFKINSRIYFSIYNKKGFSSNYIKYQIVKQDDNAHIGGYSRVRNSVKKLSNKNYYSDYFVLSQTGKYYIQIFDITNLNQWVAINEFRVVDD